jgi:hypothetical protein
MAVAAHACWDSASAVVTHAWRVARAAVRSTGAVAFPDMVATVATMAACSCCDTASMAAACSREAVGAAWMVAMAAAKLDRAMLEAAEAMATVLALKAGELP